jgi:uncharacterized coiled-coil DUF342 family protein
VLQIKQLKDERLETIDKFDELYPSRKDYKCFDNRNAVFARDGFRGYGDTERGSRR